MTDENDVERLDIAAAEKRLERQAVFDAMNARDAEEEADRQRTKLHRCGMISDLVDIVCDGRVEQTEAVEALRDELNSGARFVVLAGGVGVGKSVAAAWWFRRVLERNNGIGDLLWLHAHQLARLTGYENVENLERVEDVDFLVIDDLGLEYLDAKGWLATALDGIVYQRHGNRRLTVCTTNLTADDFKTRYGDRVADRIRQCGVFVQVAGSSRRKPDLQPPA